MRKGQRSNVSHAAASPAHYYFFSMSPELAREAHLYVDRLTSETFRRGDMLSSSPLVTSSNAPGTDVYAVFRDFAGRSCMDEVGEECVNDRLHAKCPW